MSRVTIETNTEDLLAYHEDGIAVLTMNRPERRNAMSGEMTGAMDKALDFCERSHEVRCIVLTGAGGAFCAGGDVKGMAASQGTERQIGLDEAIHLQRLSQRNTAGRLHAMPKPTIGMLPGPAAGAGLSLALACDLRTMADSAIITTAFSKVGFSGDYGGTYFLTQLVGTAKARELYFLSDRVSAQECLDLGIVNRVFSADSLEEETMALARRLADGPPIAFRYIKENLNRALAGEAMECLDLEATHHVHCGLTEDHKSAVRAFVEKKPPSFVGR